MRWRLNVTLTLLGHRIHTAALVCRSSRVSRVQQTDTPRASRWGRYARTDTRKRRPLFDVPKTRIFIAAFSPGPGQAEAHWPEGGHGLQEPALICSPFSARLQSSEQRQQRQNPPPTSHPPSLFASAQPPDSLTCHCQPPAAAATSSHSHTFPSTARSIAKKAEPTYRRSARVNPATSAWSSCPMSSRRRRD
jgi:hypothetical protein